MFRQKFMSRRRLPLPFNTENQEKVHLGQSVYIDKHQWEAIQAQHTDSMFVKQLAVAIWGEPELKGRSVTGSVCRAKKNTTEGELAKPPLSPHKVQVIKGCLLQRLCASGTPPQDTHKRLGKVNKFLCEKIMDLNKKAKRYYQQWS